MITEKQAYVLQDKYNDMYKTKGYMVKPYGNSGVVVTPNKYTYKDGPSFEGIQAIVTFAEPDKFVTRSFKHYGASRFAGWCNFDLNVKEIQDLQDFTLKSIVPKVSVAAKIGA